ncbi:hypothetical protein ACFY05_37900 [Microtetraspora fusca]|uniref:Nuclear transport factor 2 family protein n=1 Tax=Microtetraspora fusca TaxID=1997 RepID=A0ABW6VLG8_MICFU
MPGFHAFLTRLPYEPAFGPEDPAAIVDRYYAPEIEFRNDGITLDSRSACSPGSPRTGGPVASTRSPGR